MTTLQRRLSALERTAWDRRKRGIVRARLADIARDRGWTPERLGWEIQAILDDFARIEPALDAMCRQGKTLREVATWLAEEMSLDADELLAETERSGVIGGDRLR